MGRRRASRSADGFGIPAPEPSGFFLAVALGEAIGRQAASGGSSGGAMLLGADPADPFESGAQGERAAVADLGGDSTEGAAGREEQVGGDGEPPARQEGRATTGHLWWRTISVGSALSRRWLISLTRL